MDERLHLLRKIYEQYGKTHPKWKAAQTYEEWVNKAIVSPYTGDDISLMTYILDGNIDLAVKIAKSALFYNEDEDSDDWC